MAEIFLYLVNRSITAGWLILAVVLLRLLLRRAPKWISCLLWCLVGARLLVPVSIESVFSLIPSADTLSREILYAASPALDSGIESVNRVVNPMLQASFAPNPGDSVNPLQMLASVASYIWVLGMTVLLLYTVITYIRLKHRVGDAVRFQGNVFQSEKVGSPFVLGVIKPRIYIPYDMTDEERQCVIAHEQAHLARRDHLWKPLAFLILTVYWFQPLVWVAYLLLCRDIEYACDEKVLGKLGEEKKKIYSVALLHCSVGGKNYHRMIAACPIAFGEVGVKSRIKSVLHYKKPTFWLILAALLVCVVCAVCFLTNPKEDTETPDTQEVIEEVETNKESESEMSEIREDISEGVFQDMVQSAPTLCLQDALSATLNPFEIDASYYQWDYPISDKSSTGIAISDVESQEDSMELKMLPVVEYNRLEYTPFSVSFEVVPDRITVREYESSDVEDSGAEALSEKVYEEIYLIELKVNRNYEVIAEWKEAKLAENGFYGKAYYHFTTERRVLSEEASVTIEAQVKEFMVDMEEAVVISSKTDSFPGAFELWLPSEVYDKNNLKGGDMILVTMQDTGVVSNTGLPLYKAVYLEHREYAGKDSELAVGEKFTEEVNTLSGVSMQMEKYKATEGDVEITNNTDKELQYGEYYDIQVQVDEEWYSLQTLGDFAYHALAYPVAVGETRVWPVDWELVYGALPVGHYRIVKDIMDYRAPGDYTEYYLAAEFEIMQ